MPVCLHHLIAWSSSMNREVLGGCSVNVAVDSVWNSVRTC